MIARMAHFHSGSTALLAATLALSTAGMGVAVVRNPDPEENGDDFAIRERTDHYDGRGYRPPAKMAQRRKVSEAQLNRQRQEAKQKARERRHGVDKAAVQRIVHTLTRNERKAWARAGYPGLKPASQIVLLQFVEGVLRVSK